MNRPTAKQLAVRWLAASDKTEAELRLRLEKRGYVVEEIDAALRDLAQGRWVDDHRVLERELERQQGHPSTGKEKARMTLESRGIDPDMVADELQTWSFDEEVEKAAALLNSKLKPGDTAARAARLLAARGFTEEAIRAALDHRFPDWES